MLQENGMETYVKTIGVLSAHTNYFNTTDVSYFILMKIHDQTVEIHWLTHPITDQKNHPHPQTHLNYWSNSSHIALLASMGLQLLPNLTFKLYVIYNKKDNIYDW